MMKGGYTERSGCGYAALTPREKEIFNLIVMNKSYLSIASHLHIAEKTVESHMHRIHRVCGTHSKAELILYAVKSGLLTKEILEAE